MKYIIQRIIFTIIVITIIILALHFSSKRVPKISRPSGTNIEDVHGTVTRKFCKCNQVKPNLLSKTRMQKRLKIALLESAHRKALNFTTIYIVMYL